MEKVIHYFWFGTNEKPDLVQKCIVSWKQKMPDWKIIEWNESNYDVNCIPYSAEAYAAKKYAFVSDYARCKILYEYGGVYLDTDVEILQSLDNLLENHSGFMGFELEETVNPGSIAAAEKGDSILGDICKKYEDAHFINTDGTMNLKTVVAYTTEVLLTYGLRPNGELQKVGSLTIFPKEYFAPIDIYTEKLLITPNTYSIHHYTASWQPWNKCITGKLKSWCKRLVGPKWTMKIIEKKKAKRK